MRKKTNGYKKERDRDKERRESGIRPQRKEDLTKEGEKQVLNKLLGLQNG